VKPTFLSTGVLAVFLIALPQSSAAQDRSGELRLSVADASGAALPAHGMLISQANHFELSFDTSPSGEYTAKNLPLGNYKLTLTANKQSSCRTMCTSATSTSAQAFASTTTACG